MAPCRCCSEFRSWPPAGQGHVAPRAVREEAALASALLFRAVQGGRQRRVFFRGWTGGCAHARGRSRAVQSGHDGKHRARQPRPCAMVSTRWPPSRPSSARMGARARSRQLHLGVALRAWPGTCSDGKDGEHVPVQPCVAPRLAQKVRAVTRVAQSARTASAPRATSRSFHLVTPRPPSALAVAAKGAPRLPRLGFPPWTPPSEAPPPIKESPGGETHPPTRFIRRRALRAARVGPLGEDRAHHGPRCALSPVSKRSGSGSRPLHCGCGGGARPPPSRGAP